MKKNVNEKYPKWKLTTEKSKKIKKITYFDDIVFKSICLLEKYEIN